MTVPAATTLHPALLDALTTWMPRQRWFAGKGSGATAPPVLVASATVAAPQRGDDGSASLLLLDVGGTLYQVPVTAHRTEQPALAHALVARVSGLDGGIEFVYDGAHDPLFVRAWLALLAGGPAPGGVAGEPGRLVLRGVPAAGGVPVQVTAPSSVLRGEQSNTSVIIGRDGPDPLIVKLFRVVAPGPNPDVVVQTALAAGGCDRVPRPAGHLEGSWRGLDGAPVSGHLAFGSEFLAGSEDAWRVVTRTLAAGDPALLDDARELGGATAVVHEALARALPTTPASPDVLGALADGLARRVDWAVGEVPALAPHRDAAVAVVDGVRHVRGAPDLQRVHGDYHLGQVLHSPGRGWLLLDFEGEPLRPLAERAAPDLALRDVAGMLRSFDYAAGQTTLGLDPDDERVAAARVAAASCREAFLDGYAARSAHDPRQEAELLRALELDKALYEVVYEARNRPDWLAVPMAAVERLLAPSGSGSGPAR